MAERTLIIIKPDAVQRHLVGEIISRFERKSFKLVAAKFMRISERLARHHYAVHKDQPFFGGLVKSLASSPVLLTVWEADGVIDMARKIMGATFGFDAEPGTIRGDFSSTTRFNLVHGSDSLESAKREIEIYFKPEEIVEYGLENALWLYGHKG